MEQPSNYRPYSIFTPEFDVTSGGIRVMWGLFGHLLAKGQLVITNGRWNGDFTAIYPEIAHGNPLGGSKVVRYILNKPGVMASHGIPGPATFDREDEIYVFSRIYDTFGVDDDHILFLPILNLHLFKDMGLKRPNTAFFVGKGTNMALHPENAIELTREASTDQSHLAHLLNTCHTLHTYENPTAMNEIARLCGCKVIFHPEGAVTDYSMDELEEKYEPGIQGINSDLDIEGFRRKYIGLVEEFERKLDLFIENTQ